MVVDSDGRQARVDIENAVDCRITLVRLNYLGLSTELLKRCNRLFDAFLNVTQVSRIV